MSKKSFMKVFESVFSISYLIFMLFASYKFIFDESYLAHLCFWMTLILGTGDAFHLIPRIIKNIIGENDRVNWSMNFGLIVTSITMSIFYILLFLALDEYSLHIDKIIPYKNILFIITIISVLIRIIVCLLPLNNWFNGGNKKYSLIRNLIFCITGLSVMIEAFSLSNNFGIIIGFLIFLSFIFYMLVVLFSDKNKKMVMFMFPKTVIYILIILKFLKLF